MSPKKAQAPQSLSWLARWRNAAKATDAHLTLGKRGERIAARHLKAQRLRILATNYRCRGGEIDLICSDRETLVFVEVKTRSRDDWQDIAEVVSITQWRRIENAAHYFLAHPAANNRPYRFDLVTVLWPAKGKPLVEHLPDAYHPSRR